MSDFFYFFEVLIHFKIDEQAYDALKILLVNGRPFCLMPTFTVGVFKYGASINPDDEFPIKNSEYLNKCKYSSRPYEGIKSYQNQGLVKETKGKSIYVKCINLSEFLDQIRFQPTHIFMDIEGFEIDALEQLSEKYLTSNSPSFVFEHHEIFYKDGKGLSYIRQLLKENGYIVRKVYGNIVAFKS